jgi:hypothetical protein
MNKKFQSKIESMVCEAYTKHLNEFKFNGKEYTVDDIKKAAIAIGLSAAVVGGLISQLQSESNDDANLSNYEQSADYADEKAQTFDMINGLDETITRIVRSNLKKV